MIFLLLILYCGILFATYFIFFLLDKTNYYLIYIKLINHKIK